MEEPPECSIMSNSINPVRVMLVLYKLIETIQRDFGYSQFSTNIIKDSIVEKIILTLDIYDSPRQIESLIEQPDLEGRDCFWYLLKYEMYQVLDTKIFDRYVTHKWDGWLEINSSFLEFSTAYVFLRNKHGAMLRPDLFHAFQEEIFENKKKDRTHQFQLKVWKHSMRYRFLLDTVFTMFLTLFFQVFIDKYTTEIHKAEEDLAVLVGAAQKTEEMEKEFFDDLDRAMFDLKEALLISGI